MQKNNTDNFRDLKETITKLRSPGGCPWDKKQTHLSLLPFLIEESYEVLQTIEEGKSDKLCEELGDLLLQIMLHSQIASELGGFDIENVIKGINEKLIRRHPHVFRSLKVNGAEEVELNWEAFKQDEKEGESILSSVPKQMPALAYSQSIQRRVASVGFDWEHADDIIDKLVEEVEEIKNAASQEEKFKEFGDLLFTLINIARSLDIDSEIALRAANQRFFQRFSFMEEFCHQRGLKIGSLSLDEQNVLWEEAKRQVS